ncbi:MAG: hypothetical protein AB7U26_00680 [Sulfuricurvum sp.]|jgi:hypothetical protein|uniref:hypothetical protein n=1 Tax=Sulfuricurvum sp. IAE1 TaxID=2546102 RepID=UPI0014043B15|nr:hypothetical protein [Sulfuricurvum sp. IAE1]MDD3771003.1 hypothetical protein [Sulfuricurvum sp.]MDX9966239.1 hypothetical protein [Sulfuricurvum sp.]
MCFVLTILLGVASVAFFQHGLMLQGAISGVLAAGALFFFIRKLVRNGGCIFGGRRDC